MCVCVLVFVSIACYNFWVKSERHTLAHSLALQTQT